MGIRVSPILLLLFGFSGDGCRNSDDVGAQSRQSHFRTVSRASFTRYGESIPKVKSPSECWNGSTESAFVVGGVGLAFFMGEYRG